MQHSQQTAAITQHSLPYLRLAGVGSGGGVGGMGGQCCCLVHSLLTGRLVSVDRAGQGEKDDQTGGKLQFSRYCWKLPGGPVQSVHFVV